MSAFSSTNGPAPWPLPPGFTPSLVNRNSQRTDNSTPERTKEAETDVCEEEEGFADIEGSVGSRKNSEYLDTIDYVLPSNELEELDRHSKSVSQADKSSGSCEDEELNADAPSRHDFGTLFSSMDQRAFERASNPIPEERKQEWNSNIPEIYDLEVSSGSESASSPEEPPKPLLRRPIACRRRNLIGIDIVSGKDTTEQEKQPRKPAERALSHSKTEKSDENVHINETSNAAAEKGIFVRPDPPKRQNTGIRRAETGLIMSREDLKQKRSRDFLGNPAPKSFKPFLDKDEDIVTFSPASFHRRTSESISTAADDTNARSRELRSDGTDLSFSTIHPSAQSQPVDTYSRDAENSYTRFTEPRVSGLVGRLSSGLKKASTALGRKTFSSLPDAASTDILLPGTIDEAVCRICVVCRNDMDYRVTVRDTGRKIKVESKEDSDNEYLRASLVIKQLRGTEAMCAVNIKQCRSDGTKTSFAALWRFYQRLQRELRPRPLVHESLFEDESPRDHFL